VTRGSDARILNMERSNGKTAQRLRREVKISWGRRLLNQQQRREAAGEMKIRSPDPPRGKDGEMDPGYKGGHADERILEGGDHGMGHERCRKPRVLDTRGLHLTSTSQSNHQARTSRSLRGFAVLLGGFVQRVSPSALGPGGLALRPLFPLPKIYMCQPPSKSVCGRQRNT